ncbi:Xylose isomerase-like TIM barrel [Polystyrenella longa]|uniref:Xylose isomerase-like TIM barrel n=1 Tax=Polystyrenella longa TaxID=2528007 RepID=A0A518CQI3_9PLAN|nr:TIM barrel protein [Polystyrenella longa]QDU81473.1 Xylose isomerase-like TIM barrel [Polystyrenella longa]
MASFNRRDFLKNGTALAAGLSLFGSASTSLMAADKKPLYSVSLAEWSLHRAIKAGKINHLDFAKITKNDFDIDAVEYVNQFFKDQAKDTKYLTEMKNRAEGEGVKSLLIMIDGEGALGDADDAKRTQAIENHYKWVEAAKFLGCHSIRVNASSTSNYEESQKLAADGLGRLTEFGTEHGIGIIVENHGGLSSNGAWLSGVMKLVDNKNCGTLPDFGNFALNRERDEWYDRYIGVRQLMPYAKAVSAKSHDFDESGEEINTDYYNMMKIVVDAGYNGYVGIEYEGANLSEPEGIKATKALLDRVRDELAG